MILKEIRHGNKMEFLFSSFNSSDVGRKPEEIATHIHEEFEIAYWQGSEVEYEINFQKYYLDSEAIVIINKNVPHSLKIKSIAEKDTYVYIFDTNILEGAVNDYSTGKYIHPVIKGEVELPLMIKPDENRELFDIIGKELLNIYEYNNKKTMGYELKIRADLTYIFALLFEYNLINLNQKAKKEVQKTKKMEKIFYYIHENYKENITLKKASSLISLNESYFSKYFREYTGYNFVDYLNSYRLSQAAQLLGNTKIPVTDICYEVGFQNLSYFIRLFKSKFELTPGKYRKKYVKTT